MTDQVSYVDSMALGGFNYDNCIRNKAMLANVKDKGASGQLRLAKTGTTICGIVFKVRNPPTLSELSLFALLKMSHLAGFLPFRFAGWSGPLR